MKNNFRALTDILYVNLQLIPVIILRSNTKVSVDGDSSATLYCRKVAVIGTMSPLSSS